MDASDLPSTRFAVVHDVPASWDHYRLVRLEVDGAEIDGLILHAAGPTDDGFRTIDVWDTEDAWLRYRVRLDDAFDDLVIPPVVREFHVGHLVSPEFPSRNLRADRTKEQRT
jgi:hypothetical protein